MPAADVSERRILLLISAVQFVNVLDFMMVMPLGPDFAQALAIPPSALGVIGGSYTAAAAVSGIVGSLFLDRFDRRHALAVAMCGLVIGTAAGGFALGFGSLVWARIIAGAFGGPATSIALAIVADVIPPERRGRAMGVVMSAFAVASVLGVPAGLELARLGGWQMPFFAVALLGVLVTSAAVFVMPSLTRHRDNGGPALQGLDHLRFLARPPVILALTAMAAVMMGNFMIVPNLSAYLQSNLGYPRAQLGTLYMVGGVISFATVRLAGVWTDRFGAANVAIIGTLLYVANIVVGFIAPLAVIPILVVFVMFMVSSTFRMIPMQALTSRVPSQQERARFMSAQSAAQHMACAAGAMLGSVLLSSAPDGKLVGMSTVAWLSATMACVLPFLAWTIQRMLAAPAAAG